MQPNGPTIQSVLEQAVSTFFGAPTRVTGSGRTDAGVHALGQVVNFFCDREPDLHRLRRGLNALTPDDISIKDVEIVPDSFDARRDGRSRTYEYRILNRPSPSPLYLNYAWHLHDPWMRGACGKPSVIWRESMIFPASAPPVATRPIR